MYEQSLLAYIDILGWKSLIQQSVANPTLFDKLKSAMGHLRFPVAAGNAMKEWYREQSAAHPGKMDPHGVPSLHAVHFSDTVILSCPLQDRAVEQMASQVQSVCSILLALGHYTRGAIVVGGHFQDDSGMFGPALIHAYELESRTAKFPRVIVTDEALPYIDPVITLPEEGATTHFYNVRKDMDEWAYVDILGFCAGHKNEPRHPPAFPLAKSIDTVRERVRGDAEDPDRLTKHEWMLRYLEDVQRACAGHPLSESASTAPGVSSSA